MNLKEKMAEILKPLYADYEFNEEWIYRDRTSNDKNGGLCRWYAEGRKYTSFLRYTYILVYAHSTMKDCAKHGVVICEWEKPLNVISAKN